MALKSIIRYMINRYLKNYIEQLDDEKLNFDLINGHVTLENLHLKPEALVDFNLPVTVAAGYLEKLSLTIPWMNLYTHPTKIHINGLYMLIVPKNEIDRDLTEYHANKMKRVQRKVDNLRKAMLENKKLDEKEESTFFERMRLQIMQNIELTVEYLHIAYETTSTTKLGHPFSFGFTFHYFKITTTTDPNGKKRSKEITPIIYTLKEINSLSIYWNTKCQSRINMPFNAIVDDLKSKITTNNFKANNNEMNYILYPVNLTLNMVIIITPAEQNFDRLTFNIKAQLEQMSLDIDSKQFSDLLDFGKFQNYSTLYERCREYRELHLQDLIDNNKLDQLQKDRLKILESKLDVFNLAYIRHSVEIEVENKSALNSSSSNASTNKYNRWNSWWKKKNKYAVDDRRMSITTDEVYHNDGFSFYFEDLANIIVDITINKLHLNLVQSTTINTRQIITHIDVIDTKIDVTKRSVSSSLLIQFNFRSFRLYGIQDNKSKSPLLVKSISTSSSSFPMLNFQFELFPINRRRSDYRFHLNIQPIIIIYDAAMFNRIVECFDWNMKRNLFSLSEIKERTYIQMEDDLHSHKVFDLRIELKEILLRFPENGLEKENCSWMNIHFGEFLLKSCLDENQIDLKEKTNEERFYIKYKLKINNLRMIFFQSDGSCVNIVREIPLIDGTLNKCIYSDDDKLDDWDIDFKIKRIDQIQISNRIVERIISHFESIPSFNSTISEILSRINLYLEIFRSNTSLKGNISIDQCLFLIEINPFLFIQMNISSFLSKRRDKVNQVKINLQNVIMTTKKLSNPFYQNQYLQLNYIND